MDINAIPESWRKSLEAFLQRQEAQSLNNWLIQEEVDGKIVYPPRGQRFRALELTPLNQVKAVILGQDPYHGVGQAHGLSFSVPHGVKIPPSLTNIYKELQSDLDVPISNHGNLEFWARQGVLLLNSALTVEAHQAGSHAGKGWEAITDAIVSAVAEQDAPTAFILWGNHAQKKVKRIACLGSDTNHLVIQTPHPSPLSSYRGFFGSRPFSKINIFLREQGRGTIDWKLPIALNGDE